VFGKDGLFQLVSSMSPL